MNINIFWDVTLCSLVEICRRFGRTVSVNSKLHNEASQTRLFLFNTARNSNLAFLWPLWRLWLIFSLVLEQYAIRYTGLATKNNKG